MHYKAFIIGQGIAGSTLSMRMLQKHESVRVYDNPVNNNSSSVAAGILNPITGKRQALTWMAEEFFSSAFEFYRWVEEKTRCSFFHPTPVARILSSNTDLNNWAARVGDPTYDSFLENPAFTHLNSEHIANDFDCLNVKSGGWIDVPAYIESTRNLLQEMGSYEMKKVLDEEIIYSDGRYYIDDHSADCVVFCNGLSESKYWDGIEFTPMKGEILEVSAPGLNLDKILVSSCFVLPLGNDIYKVGSTYDWDNMDTILTEEGKQDILRRLNKFLKTPVEVVNHMAGIRPTVKDRRPLLGKHPSLPNMYIMNGLGSKGASLAPLISEWMCAEIDGIQIIPAEAHIKRLI